jgi:hypothetical protein
MIEGIGTSNRVFKFNRSKFFDRFLKEAFLDVLQPQIKTKEPCDIRKFLVLGNVAQIVTCVSLLLLTNDGREGFSGLLHKRVKLCPLSLTVQRTHVSIISAQSQKVIFLYDSESSCVIELATCFSAFRSSGP